MSSFDVSMEPMLDMFIYETTTLLDQLDEILLNSEKSRSFSDENINEIFRIMHTIKGSAAMMGIENISTLAHTVEDLFFILRDNTESKKHVTEVIFDLVFQSSDYFKSEIDSIQNDGDDTPAPDELVRQLKAQAAILKGEADAEEAARSAPEPVPQTSAAQAAPAPAVPEAPVSAPEAGEGKIYTVRVFFEDGCQMENIRGFMLLSQIKDYCEFMESVPDHPEKDTSLSADIIKNGFLIHFRPSGSVKEVLNVIENSLNIKSYELLEEEETVPVSSPEPSPEEEPAQKASPAAQKEPAAAAAPQAAAMTKPNNKQSLISVNQSKLDQLMDLVGELVTTDSMVESSPDLKGLPLDNFYKSTRQLRKLTDELQEVVMSIRMVPLSGVFQKMNRIVRDMSKKLGKEVEFESIGGETEVDKNINDSITDPFMHMVRNAMDHAIETPEERRALGKPENGKVTMTAQNIGGEIVITIADDGRGLDTEKIMKKAKANGILTKPEREYTDKETYGLIMLPGFSTNEVVTEFSGRGVGMDVVRKNIEKVGGSVSISSRKNEGTTFTIKIPLTLAIVDGMEIAVGDTMFILPITSITTSFKVESSQIMLNTDGAEMIMIRGECYPIIRLHDAFGIDTQVTELSDGIVIQIESGNKAACIFADELIGEQQVVVKPFPLFLAHYDIKSRGLSGCTILGDGSISLILDANNLLTRFER